MAFNDDDVTVRIGADSRRFGAGMRGAEKDLVGFEKRATRMAANLAKTGPLIVAAVGVAGVAMLRNAGRAATEIRNLSNLAGVGVEQFQKYTAAAETLGVSQEKLADIFKDVNDKFGDFAATGQGPLKDFFENIAPLVGVTADEFARLSGPEALQLYVSSLEKAGVSQQQMTFYMEALASDATGLLPLLRDNGKEMARLGDEAERAGRIMSKTGVEDGAALDRELTKIGNTIRDNMNRALVENSDEILELAEMITNSWIPALMDAAIWVGNVVTKLNDLVTGVSDAVTSLALFGGAAAEYSSEEAARIANDNKPSDSEGYPSTTGTWDLDENGNLPGLLPMTTGIPLSAAVLPPRRKSGGGNGSGGAGVQTGPTREDLERLQENFATQREILEEEYAAQLEQLQQFRENKLGTEEEYDALEADIHKKHLEDMAALEREQNAARLQAAKDVLGGMATLMASENKKLFKIGQASALANAVVSGYEAAAAAWAKGMADGGPPLAAAYTAASLVRTGALVSSIATASSSGSSGGGGGGKGVTTGGGGGAPQTSREATIQLVGGDVFGGSQIRDLINAINREQEGGAVVLRVV